MLLSLKTIAIGDIIIKNNEEKELNYRKKTPSDLIAALKMEDIMNNHYV